MEQYKIIEVKESVFADNDREAARLRAASSTLTVETAIERSSLRCEP